MTSPLDGSQAKAKAFLKDKSQSVAERMMALQKERIPNTDERLEGKPGQDIKTKVREGIIKII
jgi:hypothetical protein